MSAARSSVTSCDTLATDGFGRPVSPGRQRHVTGRLGPLEVAREHDAHHGPEGARVEGVALDHDHGAAEARLGPRGLGEVRPPDLALGDHHSSGPERAPSRPAGEPVGLGVAEAREGGVEPRGHLVGRVARDVLADAALYTSLRERRERLARRSAWANRSSGTETAVFIPRV